MPDRPSRGRLGVDIGGTFTDLVWIDDATGAVQVGKLLTTPKDPAQAVEQGVLRLLEDAGAVPAGVRSLIHGTTLAVNTVIQRSGSRTALLVTEGFRDVLNIGRNRIPDIFNFFTEMPVPA